MRNAGVRFPWAAASSHPLAHFLIFIVLRAYFSRCCPETWKGSARFGFGYNRRNQFDFQMAFHVLVYAHMRLTVLVIENACTELVDITSVMSQNLFNCIGVPSAGRANHRERYIIGQTDTLLSVSSRTAGAPRCFSLKSGAISTTPQCKRGCLRAMTYRQADTPLPSKSERSERRRQ